MMIMSIQQLRCSPDNKIYSATLLRYLVDFVSLSRELRTHGIRKYELVVCNIRCHEIIRHWDVW